MSNIQIYEAFIEAGATENKARVAAESLTEYRKTDEVATKTDIAEVRTEIAEVSAKIAEVSAKIAGLESRLTWRMVIIAGIIIGVIKYL